MEAAKRFVWEMCVCTSLRAVCNRMRDVSDPKWIEKVNWKMSLEKVAQNLHHLLIYHNSTWKFMLFFELFLKLFLATFCNQKLYFL